MLKNFICLVSKYIGSDNVNKVLNNQVRLIKCSTSIKCLQTKVLFFIETLHYNLIFTCLFIYLNKKLKNISVICILN